MTDLATRFSQYEQSVFTNTPPAAGVSPTPAQAQPQTNALADRFRAYEGGAITNPTDQAATTHQPPKDVIALENEGIKKRTGIDPSTKYSGYKDWLTRADIALSNAPAEKVAKFKAKHPKGDLIYDEPSGHYLFRTDQEAEYQKFDPGVLEAGPELGDIADLVGDIPTAVGAALSIRRPAKIAGQAVKKITQDSSKVAAGRAFLGGAGGNIAKEGVEEARGFQLESVPKQIANAALEGGSEAVGVLSVAPIEKVISIFKGPGLLAENAVRGEINRGATEYGARNLMVHQGTEYPHIRNFGNQAAATASRPIIPREVAKQQADALAILQKLHEYDVDGKQGPLQPVPELLSKSLDAYRKELLNQMNRPMPASAQYAGRMIDEGIVDYTAKSASAVQLAYQSLYSKYKPTFDLSEVQKVVTEIREGVQAATKPETKKTGIIGPDGTEVTRTTQGTIDVAGSYSTAMQELLRDISVLDTSMQTTNVDPIRQLLALRTRAYDIKTPAPGNLTPDREIAKANELYTALTKTIENPQFGTKQILGPDGKIIQQASPDAVTFVNEWKAANQMAKDRYDLLDSALVVRAARNADPVAVARNLINPHRVETIQNVKKMLGPEKWTEVQKLFDSHIVFGTGGIDAVEQEPFRIMKRLNKYDQETLNELMPRDKLAAYRYAGEKFEQLHSSGIEKALEKQTHSTNLVGKLIETNSTASIDQLYALTKGDMTSDLAKQIRRGIVENIIQNSVIRTKGVDAIDSSALAAYVHKLDETGATRFLTHEDKKKIKWLQDYTDVIGPDKGNVGNQMVSANTSSGMTNLNPKSFHKARITSPLLSWMFTSDAGNRIFYGTGDVAMDPTNLRRLGASAAILYKEMVGLSSQNSSDDQMDKLLSGTGVR